MSDYRLHDDLSFCLVDGHPVLLDVGDDRYFRLSGRTEQAFLDFLRDGGRASEGNRHLASIGLLTDTPEAASEVMSTQTASQSVLELPSQPERRSFGLLAEVSATVYGAHYRLKLRKLKNVLRQAAACRARLPRGEQTDRAQVTKASLAFLSARALVPVERCCLPDSLAMLTYLTRRRLPVNIVFGVVADPFAAHCWVQTADLVLNDTLGNTRAHTVIGVF